MDLLDPAGHIIFSVSDYQKSKTFYRKLFEQIGFKQVADSESSSAWVTPEGLGFWIRPAKEVQAKQVYGGVGVHHICFKVSSTEAVDSLSTFLKNENIHIFDEPKEYPQYTKNYYAVFFADPDGIKLEVARYSGE
jgi:catechol 2,3-dioxygenase-like lactoylglutathione lyase family enzyme